jgi:hypothetical protein
LQPSEIDKPTADWRRFRHASPKHPNIQAPPIFQCYYSNLGGRHITGLTCTAALGVWLARLAMIDDQIAPDELHLLRLVPLA